MPLPGRREGRGAMAAPWLTIISGAWSYWLYIQYGPASPSLVWDQALFPQEPWRLFTGHFIHCGQAHLLWNLPPFLFQGWLLERSGRRAWLSGVGLGLLGVNAFLALYPEAPKVYCGLSGLLNAMLVMNVFYIWLETGYHPVILALLADLFKISAEIMNGGALFTNAGWPSVPMAHGFGFAAALLFVCLRAGAGINRAGPKAG